MPREPAADPHFAASRVLSRDHERMFSTLAVDLRRFRPKTGCRCSQTSRRAYARAIFALIESETVFMSAKTLHDWVHHLGEEEQLSLRQRRRVQASNGNTIELRNRRSPAESFYTACDLYCDTWGATCPINKRSSGWHALLCAQKIRNRVTHPRSSTDLDVSDRDLEILTRADEWLIKIIVETADELCRTCVRRIEQLTAIVDQRKFSPS